MKKFMFVFVMGMMIIPYSFSQNMVLFGADTGYFKPNIGKYITKEDDYYVRDYWNYNIGFNLQLFNPFIQNDSLLSFGSMTLSDQYNEVKNNGNSSLKDYQKFMFGIKDNLYVTLDTKFIGLRAGVSGSLGIYDFFDFLFNATGLFGVCFFPKSLIALAIDVCPGFAVDFHVNGATDMSLNKAGFILPVSACIRFNLDKL
ncbi:MAG: hypothetical protein LBD07_01010 [Spirochaetaceae bacterium]|jgi:hypothetical protein|nr:hypothetical protein [Spirochaetaceae bacterium]